MAKFKSVNHGFLMRSAIRFWTNIVKNFEGAINEDEFFRLITNYLERRIILAAIRSQVPAKMLKEMSDVDRYDHLDLKNEPIEKILCKIWNWAGARKYARRLSLSLSKELSKFCSDKRTYDVVEQRFEELVRFLALSRLEAEILLFAYVQHSTALTKMPEHVYSDDMRIFIAMALNRSYDEIVSAVSNNSKLFRYECLEKHGYGFNAKELGGFLSGGDTRSLYEHYYNHIEQSPLPWAFFGKRAREEGETLKKLLQAKSSKRLNVLLYGAAGSGKTSFARSIVAELGLKGYEISQFNKDDECIKSTSSRIASIRLCSENVADRDGVIIIDEADNLLRTESQSWNQVFSGDHSCEKGAVCSLLDEIQMPTIWISNVKAREMADSVRRRFDFSISFAPLTRKQREMVWQNNVKKLKLERLIDSSMIVDFSSQYEVSAGGITMVLENLKKMNPSKINVSKVVETLMRPHCELMNKPMVDSKDLPAEDYSLDGLNVKGEVGLCDIVSSCKAFLEDDGSGVDSPRMNILLSGPPGTGKTEFVKYLASKLSMRYKVCMGSDLLSMWVGGTEERIKSAFNEAEEDGSILFFDELDGLLQSRTRAHNSWEVTQVNEILYQMEHFKGIFIGATNNKEFLDPAVLRRFTFKIDFDVLDASGKKLFFERMFDRTLTSDEVTILNRIDNVTPGDLRTVRQRLFYLKENFSNERLLKAVEEEVENKRNFNHKKIGF